MDENKKDNNRMIPYIAFESELALCERTIKRFWICCIILIISLIASNGAWIIYESQFEHVTTHEITQDIDAYSGNAIINDGVHVNGEDKTDGKSCKN